MKKMKQRYSSQSRATISKSYTLFFTHFGQVLKEDDVTFKPCFDECINRENYYKEKEELEEFNKKNKIKKSGISLIPFNYGVGIPPPFGQGGVLLNVNIDGSIVIFVGGIEMGQGTGPIQGNRVCWVQLEAPCCTAL